MCVCYDPSPTPVEEYDRPEVVRQYDAAWKRIKTPPKQNPKVRTRGQRLTQRVLATASRLYSVGDVVSPKEIGLELGICRQTASGAIAILRKDGNWPYRGGCRGVKHRRKE